MDYACTALNALNKAQIQKLAIIQNRCLTYARRAVDSTCIYNNELCSCCAIVRVEQCVLALANSWCRKISRNNDHIISFTYHQQNNTNVGISFNIIKSNTFF